MTVQKERIFDSNVLRHAAAVPKLFPKLFVVPQ